MTKQNADVLEFLRAFIAGGVNQDFKPWARELYEKLYRAPDEPRATRGYLGSTPDGSIDDADRVLEDAIPLMPDDVANKITDLVLSDGIAYVLYKADELPVVLRRQDITENRQEHALQALADQAQALGMGYEPSGDARDAARYRWLREKAGEDADDHYDDFVSDLAKYAYEPDEFDMKFDNVMAASPENRGEKP